MRIHNIYKLAKFIISSPKKSIKYLKNKVSLRQIANRPNVLLSGDLFIEGKPLIDLHRKAKLIFGKSITLNSENRGYHINMHSPVKLFADKENALISIGDNTRIHGSCIHAYKSVTIGKNCLIAANCHIIDCNGHDLSFPDVEKRIHTTGSAEPVIIEDNVWIGANSVILPGVIVGHGSVITANSVVHKSIPAFSLAGGNPAVVIKNFTAEKSPE